MLATWAVAPSWVTAGRALATTCGGVLSGLMENATQTTRATADNEAAADNT